MRNGHPGKQGNRMNDFYYSSWFFSTVESINHFISSRREDGK